MDSSQHLGGGAVGATTPPWAIGFGEGPHSIRRYPAGFEGNHGRRPSLTGVRDLFGVPATHGRSEPSSAV